MHRLVALDAGTTGVRALAVDESGAVVATAYRPLTQHFPAPGLVEHDASEICRLVDDVLAELSGRLGASGDTVAAIGVTNQRETVVALDLETGTVLAPAIVWQDRRTAAMCDELVAAGHLESVRAATGLTLDPYFSATKMRWLLDHAPLDGARRLGLGTVDALVCWHLTGGAIGGSFVTDASNASRTLLYDLDQGAWSESLCDLFGVDRTLLPEIRPSFGAVGTVAPGIAAALDGVSVAGILGDQQSALLGQRCVRRGMVKATFGTGSFLVANAGAARPLDVDGIVTCVAWDQGAPEGRTFALEGSAFVAGAAIQWLRDELGLIDDASEIDGLASSVDSANDAMFVPALSGLGSPWWDPRARGALLGLSRGVTRAHVARAVVDALCHNARAMLDAMRAGVALGELHVDGGAAAMDLLCQQLADAARTEVVRPSSIEATAVGAAYAAGIGIGAISMDDLDGVGSEATVFSPRDPAAIDAAFAAWTGAVARAVAVGSAELDSVTG